MSDLPLFWLAFAVAYPFVLRIYFPLAFTLFGLVSVPPQIVGYYQHYLYATFALAMGLTFMFAGTVSIPLGFEPWYLALVPAGVVLYYADTYAWSAYQGKPIRGATTPPVGLLPIFLVPFPEEVLFRAGLAPVLDVVGPVGYVAASAVVFGLVHFGFGMKDVVLKTVNGVLYAALFLWSGSLLVPFAVHMGYNLASFHVLADYEMGLAVPRPGAESN